MNAPADARPLDLRTRLIIRAGGWVMRLLGATWRLRVLGAEPYLASKRAGGRHIIVLWHGQILACSYAHRTPTSVLISEHRDGAIIAGVLAQFGHGAIRGSTSRGGARALLQCAGALEQGTDVAITPDGPRGPRHSFAAGALALAFRTGAPLVAIVAHADRAWRLRSWDAFEIPKPFARVTVMYSEARAVDAPDLRTASARADEFAAWMHGEHARVERLAQSRVAHGDGVGSEAA